MSSSRSSQVAVPQQCEAARMLASCGHLSALLDNQEANVMTLRAELQVHLQSELDDPTIARALVDIVWQDALSWGAPVTPVDEITAIVAFTFGNRMLPNGNREPGPVNAALANVVAALHQKTSARI